MVQKNQRHQKYVILVKCVEDVVPRNEYYKSFGNVTSQRTQTSRTVQIILKEFYAKVKNKYDLLALPPHKFLSCLYINIEW